MNTLSQKNANTLTHTHASLGVLPVMLTALKGCMSTRIHIDNKKQSGLGQN